MSNSKVINKPKKIEGLRVKFKGIEGIIARSKYKERDILCRQYKISWRSILWNRNINRWYVYNKDISNSRRNTQRTI